MTANTLAIQIQPDEGVHHLMHGVGDGAIGGAVGEIGVLDDDIMRSNPQ